MKQDCCCSLMCDAHQAVRCRSLPWVVDWIPFNQPCTALVSATPAVFSEWKAGLTATGFSITDNVSPSRLYRNYSSHVRPHLHLYPIWYGLASCALVTKTSCWQTAPQQCTCHTLSDLIGSPVILDRSHHWPVQMYRVRAAHVYRCVCRIFSLTEL